MTQLSGVVATDTAIGNREDLEDIIYRVSPEETPFISNIGSTKANAIFHEWQTESLDAAVNTNKAIEGNVFTIASGNLTTRIGNGCQIFTKTFAVSRTEDVVKKAGRVSETARQKVIKGLSMRRDVEYSAISNLGYTARNSTTAGVMGGALSWFTSNTSVGSGGSNGTYSGGPVAATNGTQRTFTESLVKTVMASAFNNGGRPSQAYMSAADKQVFSTFTGIADIRVSAAGNKMASIVGAADVYVSDFGNLALIPHPYALSRDCMLIDPSMWALATLDGVKTVELARTADADQYAITQEATIVCRNEKASGVIRDLL